MQGELQRFTLASSGPIVWTERDSCIRYVKGDVKMIPVSTECVHGDGEGWGTLCNGQRQREYKLLLLAVEIVGDGGEFS